ncbi:alpha-1 3-mannosyl-glycoprotein beta-1 2-N-acetylglucosaminyltransferase [Clonorchis sinensis]|uniref:Alpha-1,3-mannosyl-glycoprotein 2-beta-N-acetylglucosaminyltransferase n=1 Tax=Clonorchis sinensis TaxID=79923 RepID=G7YHF8_CLOSI|nr:alpha-1 3-mannosyl-glycoprotein beta-1 2-N-acetylglucosaminyltransferase [Clonorchis sinensis]
MSPKKLTFLYFFLFKKISTNKGMKMEYQMITHHYKKALDYMFLKLNHSVVIVVEDDLDIAPDFFEYFVATLPLLSSDPSLFCVSAWNDNGRLQLIDPERTDLIYRNWLEKS